MDAARDLRVNGYSYNSLQLLHWASHNSLSYYTMKLCDVIIMVVKAFLS